MIEVDSKDGYKLVSLYCSLAFRSLNSLGVFCLWVVQLERQLNTLVNKECKVEFIQSCVGFILCQICL